MQVARGSLTRAAANPNALELSSPIRVFMSQCRGGGVRMSSSVGVRPRVPSELPSRMAVVVNQWYISEPPFLTAEVCGADVKPFSPLRPLVFGSP